MKQIFENTWNGTICIWNRVKYSYSTGRFIFTYSKEYKIEIERITYRNNLIRRKYLQCIIKQLECCISLRKLQFSFVWDMLLTSIYLRRMSGPDDLGKASRIARHLGNLMECTSNLIIFSSCLHLLLFIMMVLKWKRKTEKKQHWCVFIPKIGTDLL